MFYNQYENCSYAVLNCLSEYIGTSETRMFLFDIYHRNQVTMNKNYK